jgi:predicted RNA-binding protein with PUA-like domain
MANRWLLKTDPDDYNYDDLEREGRVVWDGVTNNLALQNIRKISKGDALIIYHTGDEKAIIGLAEAVSNPYPDPRENNEKLAVLDVKPKRRAKRAVTLTAIKAVPELATFPLVCLPRLSVMPVTEAEWQRLRKMAGW